MTDQEQYERAVQIIRAAENPGLSILMRELNIRYNAAAMLFAQMEDAGIVTCIQPDGNRRLIKEQTK